MPLCLHRQQPVHQSIQFCVFQRDHCCYCCTAALAAHERSCTDCADDVNCPSTFHSTCTCVSDWTFTRAGHSLGGALATLAAYDIQAACKCLPKKSLSVYTFGAPRVGNHAFAREYNQAVFETWNVINGK